MSVINLTRLLDVCQAKVIDQYIIPDNRTVNVIMRPDRRYYPICSSCKRVCKSVHSYTDRNIRDMNVFNFKTMITCCYRKVKCAHCGVKVEDIGLTEPGMRITKRFAEYIAFLCRFVTIADVAKHVELDWKTVKDIHKKYLLEKFSQEEFGKPKKIVVDEVAIRKGHEYLTVVIDWDTRQVLWMRKDRKTESLKSFYEKLTQEQKDGIEAVAMDMWDPFIKATKEGLPKASIVFDQFHVVRALGKTIDKIRRAEYFKASQEDKAVIQGSKYILLKNSENLCEDEKVRLDKILAINENISKVLILKDLLKKLWDYRCVANAEKFLEYWCNLAMESGIRYLRPFVRMIRAHVYGLISHCDYPIHTSKIEGFNNKIKVIKRKAYGFNDIDYFILLVKDAFFSN